MIHRRIDLLRKLLALSRIHLQLGLEEKWEDWETVARQKLNLYKELMAFKGPPIHPAEKEIIDAIREVENQASEELTLKKNEVKKELVEIDRFSGGIKSYRHSPNERSKRHFAIKV